MTVLLAAAAALALGGVQGRTPPGEVVYRPGNGVSNPKVVVSIGPRYTSDALRRKIQGSVFLDAVVEPDGTVGDVVVSKSLDAVYGLDDESVTALKQWRFTPGMRDGHAVAVRVQIQMAFTMGKSRGKRND